jgi:hypothetical protein
MKAGKNSSQNQLLFFENKMPLKRDFKRCCRLDPAGGVV